MNDVVDTTRMLRLDEEFAMTPNDPVIGTWRRAMAAIEGRLRALEDQRADYDEAIRVFEELALARINEVLLPALEVITLAAELGFLLVRSSTEASLIPDERIHFFVEEGPQRDLFTPTPFVAIQRTSTPDDYAVGYVEAYDRETGYLLTKVLAAYGSSGPFDDWVISAAPGVSEATRSYWERALISAQATERDAAQTAEDRIYVEAARQALEEAGLNPDQYVWRDGTRSFTAVVRGVAPDAIADDATMPTSFWTRRRVNEGVASLQTGAPASLNNFARTAAALGNDPNFAATLRRELNAIAVPVGGVIAWASATLPANFLRCDGAVYNIADAPLLFAVFGAHYGGDGVSTFAVPNLLDRTVVGAGNTWGLNAAGGTINHSLTVNEMPHHAHGVGDPAHAHALADPSHTHGVHDPGHGHGDPGHAHTIPLPGSFGFMWGANGLPSPLLNQGEHHFTSHGSGTGLHAAAVGTWLAHATSDLGVHLAHTGVATHGAGDQWAHNNMPPFLALNFIIRFE